MAENIIQKVYYSISNHEVTPHFINGILEQARLNNEKIGVTGCLLYHNNVFLQLLEGEEKTIDKLFDKIATDNRHKEVTLVCEEKVEQRIFPNWSMAYHNFEQNSEQIKKFVDSIQFYSENNEMSTDAIEFFWNMARQIVN